MSGAAIKVQAGDVAYIKRGRSGGWDRRHFTKAYETAWQAVYSNHLFTPQETHTLLFLGAYTEAESNAVVGADGPMTTLEIAKGLGWSERNTRRVLATLQKKNVIFYGGSAGEIRYFVNPSLFGKGGSANATTRRMFDDRKSAMIRDADGMLEFLRIGRKPSNIVVQ